MTEGKPTTYTGHERLFSALTQQAAWKSAAPDDIKETAARMIKIHGRVKASEWAWEHAFANRQDGKFQAEAYWQAVKAEIDESLQ